MPSRMAYHRLFVAIRPPVAICEALLDPMEALEGARWQDFENLHLTLRFIGEVPKHSVDDLALALSQVEVQPFALSISGVGHFERKGMANAVWARIAPSDQLCALHERVDHACRRAGLVEEARKYIPHITIARLNRSTAPIAPWLARHDGLSLGPWDVRGFQLYESRLSSAGAHYQPIAQFPA